MSAHISLCFLVQCVQEIPGVESRGSSDVRRSGSCFEMKKSIQTPCLLFSHMFFSRFLDGSSEAMVMGDGDGLSGVVV